MKSTQKHNHNTKARNKLKLAPTTSATTVVVGCLLTLSFAALLSNASMCQYMQQQQQQQQRSSSSSAINHDSAAAAEAAASLNQRLVSCAKPQPQPQLSATQQHSPQVQRAQQQIMRNLNVSLSNYLPLEQRAALNNADDVELISNELIGELVPAATLNEAFARAKLAIVARRKFEAEMARQGHVTDMSKKTAVSRHQRVTTTSTRANELEKAQEVFEEMSRILAQNLTAALELRPPTTKLDGDALQPAATSRIDLSVDGRQLELAESVQLLTRVDLHSSESMRRALGRCEEEASFECDANFPYRHADGRCNNLRHPTWGKANTCFARLLPADYSDGQSAPRISVTGQPLPNPRILSAIVHRDFNYPATYTHFVMQYGQFFAHDIAFTPSSRTKNGQMIQCCPVERDLHPQCFPILVPPDDPFYSNWDENCLNFVRTAVCPRCRLGPREQMNQITSFIDGSQVYGAAANETAALWTKSGPAGRMHVSLDDNGRELLPHSADPSNDQCSDVEKGQFCYRAGDRRVNQHPALTSVHVMWLRQHNRIVNGLKMINPHWNGDRLYQEAKRIATAQMQMVTYNEWLTLVIGQEAMKFLKLSVLPEGYTQYDSNVEPTLLNEFSGAAFRFGHSMINNIFAEIMPDGRPSGYRLNEFFFHPFGLRLGQHDMVMRGLISQASQNRDPFVSSDIKNHLYRPRDNPYGLDLPAFNIQRGRDHGIPGYTKLIEFCFDDQISSWKQLDQYMPVSQRIRFSKLYRSVHDLDLFSAGLAEYPLPGAALGPTFTCIVGIQMFNLKFGDRFWFEHGNQAGSFTPPQLQELRKTNLARLVCANSDNISIVQRNVFRGESPSNPSVSCSSLPDTDLKAWRELPGTRSAFSDFTLEQPATSQDSVNSNRQTRHVDYNTSNNTTYNNGARMQIVHVNVPFSNIDEQREEKIEGNNIYSTPKSSTATIYKPDAGTQVANELGNEYSGLLGNSLASHDQRDSKSKKLVVPVKRPRQLNLQKPRKSPHQQQPMSYNSIQQFQDLQVRQQPQLQRPPAKGFRYDQTRWRPVESQRLQHQNQRHVPFLAPSPETFQPMAYMSSSLV